MFSTLRYLVVVSFVLIFLVSGITSAETVHRVENGETLFSIALAYGVNMEEIISINPLHTPDKIYVKQVLIIPDVIMPDESIPDTSSPSESVPDEIMPDQSIPEESIPEEKKIYNGPDYHKEFSDIFHLQGKTDDYKVVLTFDDGPDNEYTPAILDVLKDYDVPATFFLVGNRMDKYNEVVTRIIDEGHLIGNHTWSHTNLTKISIKDVEEEIAKTDNLINKFAPTEQSLIRAPYGAISEEILLKAREMNYEMIHWSVDSQDWLVQDVDQILINTLTNIKKGSIILFHSAGGKNEKLANTVKVLPELIDTLRMEGYSFVNLDEFLAADA